jgi:aspartyl-tRNA(Asn)/glutamyl-tRNA(Gln) amidotransferase subunit A
LSATELVTRYRSKDLSPVEAVGAVLDRIDRHNGTVNAFCHVDAAGALKSARESQARWLAGAPTGMLDGVPIGIKDNILVAGMPTRFGSRLTSGDPSTHDAPAVARLRERCDLIGRPRCPNWLEGRHR